MAENLSLNQLCKRIDRISPEYVGLTSNVLMVEAAYVVVLGLEAIVRFDWLDPDINVSKDDLSHVVVGFEWFPYSFIEIRPQYRFIIENPSVTNDAAVLQFHFWY